MAAFALFGKPKTLLDLGCGQGDMVKLAARLGVAAIGVDISPPIGGPFLQHDLREPLDLGKKFDMILCIEVAEHLPEVSAMTICDTIARHGKHDTHLIFSAATPGQGGDSHENLKLPIWWRDRLYEAGKWSFKRHETSELALMWSLAAGPLQWLVGNVQVF